MANRTITFLIEGRDKLSAAVNAAKNSLNSLKGATGKINALQRALANSQNLQKMIGDYRNLQRAIQASQSARAQELLKASRAAATQSQAVKQLEKMRDAMKNLQKYQRGERANLDVDKASVARLKSALQQHGATMNTDAARIMREQIRAAEREIKSREKSLNQIMKGAKLDLSAQEAAIKNFGNAFSTANAKAQQLRATLASQQSQLAALRSSMSSQGLNGTLAAHELRLRAEIQQTINALNRETEAFNRRNAAAQRFSQAQQNMANAYSNFQDATQTAETIMNPFTEATKVAMTFERQMSRVKAVTQMRDIRAGNLDKVAASMKALTEQAEHLGATTEFTSVEVAKGMEKFGYAGWTAEQIQAAMPSMVDLATISPGHNIERMADILSDTATAMGIKAGDTVKLANGQIVDAFQHYADTWAYATTTANLNDEDLFTALKYNAGAMKLAGLTQGDIFAANMVVANAGLKGSMAGTAFRSGMIRLQAPAKKGAQALEEMGFNASEAQKEMAAAGQAMKELGIEGGSVMDKIVTIKKRFDELGAAGQSDAQAALINDIFGKHAYQAWAEVLRSNNLEQLKKIADEINSGYVDGWSADAAKIIRENSATEVDYLTSAWDALAKSVGDAFLPAVTAAAKALTNFVNAANNFVKNNQAAVQWLGLFAGALSGIIVAGAGIAGLAAAFNFISGGLMIAVGAARSLVTVLSAARAAVMAFGATSAIATAIAGAPIWLIVAAVAAVIGIVAYATGCFDGLGDAIANAFNHPQGAITGFCELAKSSIDSAVDYILARWLTLKSALSHPIEAIINFVDHGDVVGGNVVNGSEQVQNIRRAQRFMPFLNNVPVHTQGGNGSGGSFGSVEVQNAVVQAAQVEVPELPATSYELPAVQVPPVDTSAIQDSFASASFASQNLSSALMTASPATQALSFSAQLAANSQQLVANSAQAATGGIYAMSASAASSTGSISSMAGASSSAAGSISGLGAAAQSAIGALVSAGASAAGAIHGAIGAAISAGINAGHASVAHNAEGGIYNRGSFLTTFAEKSPEAAVPINNSARAKNLWLETGNLLGMFDGGGSSNSVTVNLTMNFAGEKPADNSWVDDVRQTFEDLANEYFANRRRVSYA